MRFEAFVKKYMLKGIFLYLWLAFASAFFAFITATVTYKNWLLPSDFQIVQIVIIAAFIAFAVFLKIRNKLSFKSGLILIFTAAFLMRVLFIAHSNLVYSQHDLDYIRTMKVMTNGHFGYILTIVNTGRLPLTNDYQMYHPPLMHFICAVILKIQLIIGIPLQAAAYTLRMIPLFASTVFCIIWSKIILRLNLSKTVKLVSILIIVFHPYGIILSNSLNNDALMWMFFSICVLQFIRWYDKPSVKNAVLFALSLGFGMMTKFSAVLILPAAALVLIIKFKKEKNSRKQIGIHAGVVFSISAPIGMWYQLRNLVLFGQTIGYVPEMSQNSLFYKGWATASQRFSLNLSELLNSVFPDYNDVNAWNIFLKSSIFDDFQYEGINIPAILLTVLNMILIILSVLSVILLLLRIKNESEKYIYVILGGVWLVLIGSFIKFMIDYPYYSTSSFRYIAAAMPIGAILTGKCTELFKNKKVAENAFAALGGCFAMLTIIVYSSKFVF